MAFVGISYNLSQDVTTKIYKMRDAEIASLGIRPSEKISLQGSEAWLHEAIWGEHIALRNMVPAEWCENVSSVDTYVLVGAPPEVRRYGVSLFFAEKISLRPGLDSRRYSVTMRFDSVDSLPLELKPYVEWCVRCSDVTSRWDKVRTQVVDFLNNCKSLNEALKLWPDLRVYIPEAYLERVDRKAERQKVESKAAETLAKINTDEIMAAAVIGRIAGAQA